MSKSTTSTAAVISAWQQHLATCLCFTASAGRAAGLSLIDIALIETLGVANAPATPSYLARQLAIPMATATTILDRLEAKSFIRRSVNPTDARSIIITLGPAAAAFGESELRPTMAQLTACADKMSDAEKHAFTTGLTTFAQVMGHRNYAQD